jgi:excisionase family DNA binding protein
MVIIAQRDERVTDRITLLLGRHSMQTNNDEIMTIDELAVYVKVSKSTLYKLVQGGKVPGQKIGKHWRFRRETIDRWLDADSGNTQGQSKPAPR